MLNPSRRINSSLAMSAAVAGIIAGVSLSAGCNSKKVAEKPTVDPPNTERHGCSGQNGCNGQHKVEAKTEIKDQKTKEHNGCNSANGCKAS